MKKNVSNYYSACFPGRGPWRSASPGMMWKVSSFVQARLIPCVASFLLTVCLFASTHGSAVAAVIMETNGKVMSIGTPPPEPQTPPDDGSGDRIWQTPPRDKPDNSAGDPNLPWGIVPEVHVPWIPPQGGNRPGGRPPQIGGESGRPGANTQPGNRPPSGWESGQGGRPPSGWNPYPGGQPKPPGSEGWRPSRPQPGQTSPPAFSGRPDSGFEGGRPNSGRPGAGTPPQLVRPPLGSPHTPGGRSGSSVNNMP